MATSLFYCDNCGAANQAQATSCFACGWALQSTVPVPPPVPVPNFVGVGQPQAMAQVVNSFNALLAPNHLLKQRYRIIGQVGKGGFGAVYKAMDIRAGSRLVAVKEVNPGGQSLQETAEATEAFKHEALLLTGLAHQSLPHIYDHFSEAGCWYLVMDFIAGETLEAHLTRARGRRLPLEEVFEIGLQLCDVLDYLHTRQQPIVFRDLKPGNVILTPMKRVYLIDFGIARHFKVGQAKDTVAFGSPGYAAPEQYGKAQTTPRSDIYSLGATLHQLLTGDDPTLTPFHFAPLHVPGQAVPPEFEALIMQMLEIKEYKRPADMNTVKWELKRIAAQYKQGITIPRSAVAPRPVAVPKPASPAKKLARVTPRLALSRRTVVKGLLGLGGLAVAGLVTYTVVQRIQWSDTPVPVSSSPQPVATPAVGTTLYTIYRGHSAGVDAVAWNPVWGQVMSNSKGEAALHNARIASASQDRTVQVWDAATGGNSVTYRGHSDYVFAVAWSPDGKFIASASADRTVQVWDALRVDHGNVYRYGGHTNYASAVAWSPDGKRIASGSWDATVQVWDTNIESKPLIYHGHSSIVYTVAWSPNGQRIASGGLDNTVQVWDAVGGDSVATTGKSRVTYPGHSSAVRSVAWSPDGKRIASASDDQTVQVWEAATGKHIFTYAGHNSAVNAIAWSPDGKRIASASDDQTVQVWNAPYAANATVGGDVFTYPGHTSWVRAVALSPDGKLIASASFDQTVQVWAAR